MNQITDVIHSLDPEELRLLSRLREARGKPENGPDFSFGDLIADRVAAIMGSWNFIIIQTGLLILWIVLNVLAYVRHWDPYPFILLNLALSFQAAYAAPVIMMSQNRQAAIDRAAARADYGVNTKAELEIELLHQKLDLLRETEVTELITIIKRLEARLPEVEAAVASDQRADGSTRATAAERSKPPSISAKAVLNCGGEGTDFGA